jgi:lipopolysaccharide transport system permease protein
MDFIIGFLFFCCLMPFYGYYPQWSWIVSIPLLTLLTLSLAFGISLWLGALNVRYRDVSHVMPLLMQLWMFATPIVYPLSLVPESYRWIVSLNPMVGIIQGFRVLLLGGVWDTGSLVTSVVLIALLIATGLLYFGKTERTFADNI